MSDENPTPFRPTVAVDFDGPIHAYTRGWQNGALYDDPTPGALDAVALLAQNYRVVVFTARTDLEPVYEWLREHEFIGFGHDDLVAEATNAKPQAQVYIDDRAVYFDTALGDQAWATALNDAEGVMIHHAEQKSARGAGA